METRTCLYVSLHDPKHQNYDAYINDTHQVQDFLVKDNDLQKYSVYTGFQLFPH